MKTQCLTLILGLWSISGFTQELVSTSGDHFEANGLQLDFSIGEAVTETFDSGVVLTQGFHQTLLLITSVPEVSHLEWQVGPNPVMDVLNVQFSHESTSQGYLEVMNMQGQVVFSQGFGAVRNLQLDLSSLASGMYVMRATDLQEQPISQTLLIQKL